MKCALFDLDETLFDHRYSSQMGIAALCRIYPVLNRKTVEELEEESWQILNRMYKDVLAGRITSDKARLERISCMFKGCGADVPEKILDELSKTYTMEYWKSVRSIPGAVTVLKKLKANHYTTVVLTNGFREVQMKKIMKCGIEGYIDHVITSHEVGFKKPQPEIYFKALDICNAESGNCIMVGDAWDIDIMGAVAAGIESVWINRRREPCPDSKLAKVIYEPIELLDILKIK